MEDTRCRRLWFAFFVWASSVILFLDGLNTVLVESGHQGFWTASSEPSLEPNLSLPHIAGTNLYGTRAVQFRKRLDCYSRSGEWVYDPTPRYITENVFGSAKLRKCDVRFAAQSQGAVTGDRANEIAAAGQASNWIVREQLKWCWRTDDSVCPFREVDRDDLCRQIGTNRNVLVVGDSINQEIYWILLNHLVKKGWKVPRTAIGEKYFPSGLEVCADVLGGTGQGFRVQHVRNDRFSMDRAIEYSWGSSVEHWNVSVLILDRDAHFVEDGDYTESLVRLFTVTERQWPSVQVFYRSTPPGHLNCMEHQEPLTERVSDEWLDSQNEMARKVTEQFGHIFLDVSSMMALRPDSHVGGGDCMHYCLPGPLDVFAQLLYNTLRLLPQGQS